MSKLKRGESQRKPESQAADQVEFNISSECNDVDTLPNSNHGEIYKQCRRSSWSEKQ